MPTTTPKKYLTTGDVAAVFEVSQETVRAWADDGKIRSWRTPGGQRRFRWEDIEAFLPPDGEAA